MKLGRPARELDLEIAAGLPASRQRPHNGAIRVWDPFVRISHWLVALLVTVLVGTGFSGNQDVHLPLGVDALVLVLARIGWGFVGDGYAHFRNFVRPPGEFLSYCLSIVRGHPARYLGHNPAGGWMVVLLLGTLLCLCGSGVFLQAELEYEGWLVGAFGASDQTVMAVLRFHQFALWALLSLVPLHLLGVALASRQHRENLVLAMFTGEKSNHQSKPGGNT